MRWIDLLRMSSSNLKRRKLRTFLTVLGVVIGTASIVVMISLGLGMQQSIYRQIEESGGATAITVRRKDSSGMMHAEGSETETDKYVTDDTIKELQNLEHVKSVSPALELDSMLLKGKYYGNIQLVGVSREELARQNMKLVKGSRLPGADAASLELVFGNGIPTMFSEKGGGGYWDTGELPDIDFMNDQMFLILDGSADYSSQEGGGGSVDAAEGGKGSTTARKPPKKYVVKGTAMVDGGIDDYNNYYYYVYCDIEKLIEMLKKEYAGRAIPGQPTTKNGKPYKFFAYSYAKIQADDIENVDELTQSIQNMGYMVETNAEYMEAMQKELLTVEAVLGGIGAVSLLVAAIGIANTMMMSIYERTKEIGVIKVLGCSLRNIKEMFLMEAAFIGFAGGLIGNMISFVISWLINFMSGDGGLMGVEGNISYIPVWLVLVSLVFAVLVGMAAGYFPARRAMKLSPLAAIRNE